MIETLLGGLLGGAFRLAPELLKWLDRTGVTDYQRPTLSGCQVIENDHRNGFKSERLRGRPPAMSSNNDTVGSAKNRICKAIFNNGCSDQSDLLWRVSACVSGVGQKFDSWPLLDFVGQPGDGHGFTSADSFDWVAGASRSAATASKLWPVAASVTGTSGKFCWNRMTATSTYCGAISISRHWRPLRCAASMVVAIDQDRIRPTKFGNARSHFGNLLWAVGARIPGKRNQCVNLAILDVEGVQGFCLSKKVRPAQAKPVTGRELALSKALGSNERTRRQTLPRAGSGKVRIRKTRGSQSRFEIR